MGVYYYCENCGATCSGPGHCWKCGGRVAVGGYEEVADDEDDSE